ncbi:MAG: hypothetical protein HQM14_18750 [SAR324 cluster bacterium]|nr:hypothetical protein [SAR324 cluster bacterium]
MTTEQKLDKALHEIAELRQMLGLIVDSLPEVARYTSMHDKEVLERREQKILDRSMKGF